MGVRSGVRAGQVVSEGVRVTWAVVVPSCRPDRLETFKRAWSPLFRRHNAVLYVVEDQPPWDGIPDFIPKRTDMIRSWGFYQAWRDGHKYTLSLDDDVLPIHGIDIFQRYEDEFHKLHPFTSYLDVGSLTSCQLRMRGFPAREGAPAIVQYGGWDGVPDLGGQTQIDFPVDNNRFERVVVPVPVGSATTCCAMNFAFRTEFTEIMWQLPLVGGLFNRWGDIWSGLVQKAVLDSTRAGVMLINGKASVLHERASDPFANRDKEAPGLDPNESVWGDFLALHRATGRGSRVRDQFEKVTYTLGWKLWGHDGDAWREYKRCRDEWRRLFD